MTEIATADDLWKLFSKEPTDHTAKGEGFILWQALNQVLAAKTFVDGTQALKLDGENSKDRFYHLVSYTRVVDGLRLDANAVVRQCDLRKVATPFNSLGQETMVGYLGTLDR